MLLGYLLAVGRDRRVALIEDDAYYYLGVARSIANGDGSTFSGLVATNGYHPLWLIVLVPVTALVQEAGSLAVAVVAVQGLIWAASVREALRIGDRVGRWEWAAGAIAVYSVSALLTGHLAFNGMESGLLLYLLLLLIRVALDVRATPHPNESQLRDDLRLGVIAALVLMARLDAVFALVSVGVVLLLWRLTTPAAFVRRAAALGAPVAAALIAYVTVNYLVFDTPLPVSGQAKALDPSPANFDQISQFFQTGQILDRPIWFGAIGVATVVVALVSNAWRANSRLRLLMALTCALVVGQALLLAYTVAFTTYAFSFAWYHYQLALFAFCGAIVIARWADARFGRRVRSACVCIAACVPLFHGVSVLVEANEDKELDTFHAADFVHDELPADTVIAMGDRAGYFGYIAERPLLHLEGLVADKAYLDQLERGEALDRMRSQGVDYYVHRGRGGLEVELDGQRCWRFTEPAYTTGPTFEVTACENDLVFAEGHPAIALSIWKFRPDLQESSAL
jgi:hypothetical protein